MVRDLSERLGESVAKRRLSIEENGEDIQNILQILVIL